MSDDEVIGLKSTSIKFKKNIRLFVSTTYLISSILIIFLLYDYIGANISTIFLIFFIYSLIYQLINFKKNNVKDYLKLFKYNNYTGLLLFLSIFLIK